MVDMTPGRRARLREALDRRLGHVCVAVEAVHHRHNISAILRTCDALGVHHVHLVEGHFSPSQGAARGTERWLHLHKHDSAEAAVEAIQAAGYAIWIADLADDAVPPEGVPVDEPVCLWMGAELVGVGAAAKAAAVGVITIPMHGLAQSLNVSVAAAITARPIAERARAELGEAALLGAAERAEIWSRWMAREEAARAGAARRSGES
ncbi:MAG: RNA methyltransferase [Deltaproteobacteria bacterium]|nr:RNA methyltransferase [Deltaproteobacteria bacterium]